MLIGTTRLVYAAGSSFWLERVPGRDHDPGPDFVPGIGGSHSSRVIVVPRTANCGIATGSTLRRMAPVCSVADPVVTGRGEQIRKR